MVYCLLLQSLLSATSILGKLGLTGIRAQTNFSLLGNKSNCFLASERLPRNALRWESGENLLALTYLLSVRMKNYLEP